MSLETHSPVREARDPRPGATIARFFEARGYPVHEVDGVIWTRPGRTWFRSLPFGNPIDPDIDALRRALRSWRAIGASYATLTRPGAPTGLFACFPRDYSLANVESGHRRQVRRGLERAEFRAIDADELLAQGFALNLETMARQQRFDPEMGDPARWRIFVRAARDCPGMGMAGAFIDGRLVAYWVSCREPPWLHLMVKMARTEDLIHRAAVALDFWMLTEAAKDPAIEAVSNSNVAMVRKGDGLDRYKRAMGFQVLAHHRAVELHPLLRPVVTSPAALVAAETAARLRPESPRLEALSKLLAAARAAQHAH